ncbi:Hypothetical protein A7982_05831 [Minicystis rosea]|nr:Hypothetical protein A7982_05831 [Minicystis rosea]
MRAGSNLHVFRHGRRRVAVDALIESLRAAITRLAGAANPAASRDLATDTLILAGELECVLADHGAPGVRIAMRITDRLAETAEGAEFTNITVPVDLGAGLPASVSLSPPESFTWYGLSPNAFARLASSIDVPSGTAAVVGIRSIGTTLSAVVATTLQRRGLAVDRVTVRPAGHPYDRVLHLDPETRAWITGARDRGASFLVVDEGPGMSGSSFLSVGEALAGVGVDPRRIVLLGTHAADPSKLLARDAARRFAALGSSLVVPPTQLPADAAIDVSGGLWRATFCGPPTSWPAAWPTFERIKHLSADGSRLFKFEGLGRAGEEARMRARAVAEAGFGPMLQDVGDGFVVYPVIAGRPLRRGARRAGLLDRIADYCAFRARAFAVPIDGDELREMVRWNSEVELGRAIDEPLEIERPIIADARMDPHEWIETDGVAPLKVDAAAHGDDHGYPGPTDVAWDLAGAIVEWEVEGLARATLLARYARISGDRAISGRLPAYVRAYALARMARAKMAAGAMAGTMEAPRLLADDERYRRALEREMPM